jgi:TIR domain
LQTHRSPGRWGQNPRQFIQRAAAPALHSFNPDLPGSINRLIQKALAKDCESLYQIAGKMAIALEVAVAVKDSSQKQMKNYIYISYSHKDWNYVRSLEKTLEQKGFNVWIDKRLDYGSDWPIEIQKKLDDCGAMVLVMSSNSFKSKWVQNELNRALRKGKPVFPLLLEGDEPWLAIESIQYIDVTSGKMPEEKFYQLLAGVLPRRKMPEDREQPGPAEKKPFLEPKNKRLLRVLIWVIGCLAILAMLAGVIIIGMKILPILVRANTPTATAIFGQPSKMPFPRQSSATHTPAQPSETFLPPSETASLPPFTTRTPSLTPSYPTNTQRPPTSTVKSPTSTYKPPTSTIKPPPTNTPIPPPPDTPTWTLPPPENATPTWTLPPP